MNTELTAIEQAVLSHYLETGKRCDRKEIARRLEVSSATVGKLMRLVRGMPTRCDVHTGTSTCPHRGESYTPAKQLLARLLNETRNQRDEAQKDVCWRARYGRPGHESAGDYETVRDAAREFGWLHLYPACKEQD